MSRPLRTMLFLLAAALIFPLHLTAHNPAFTDTFRIGDCSFVSRGSTPYFILQPGFKLILEGEDDGELVRLEITVLDQTRVVAGVTTRIVEERETHGGELVEVSRNYFAICRPNNSVFYFGEHVDNYENGVVVNHDGSWLAGVNGARAGVIMPGIQLIGARYYQEVAPGVALDRAETLTVTGQLTTPAGTFTNVLITEETTPLEPNAKEYKYYAPWVGLIQDGPLQLVWHSRM